MNVKQAFLIIPIYIHILPIKYLLSSQSQRTLDDEKHRL